VCQPPEPGVICGPGNNRRTRGGGGAKVPHNDGLNAQSPATRSWPSISGVLWAVLDGSRTPRARTGGSFNDELLGHHGSDRLFGGPGHDVMWGDWDPNGNSQRQRDVLEGGPGNDWLYPSHGRSIVSGGPGMDYVWAYYGTGRIDCGPGIDTARIRTNRAFTTKNCERIRHFCSNGENRRGQCLSPSGRPVTGARRAG
jgi:Ca2+-binding RTX toxin-like protein